MKHDGLKKTFQNILVDAASVIELVAASTVAAYAFTTLYSSFYQTGSLPTPESFASASVQFAVAISLIFAVFSTRKYRVKDLSTDSSKPN